MEHAANFIDRDILEEILLLDDDNNSVIAINDDNSLDNCVLLLNNLDETNDEVTSSSGSSSELTEFDTPKRKFPPLSEEQRQRRNARRRASVKRIRLPKDDLRRNIPTMVMNVTNSCDKGLIQGFFQRYGHPNMLMTSFSPALLDLASSHITVRRGVDKMTGYITSFVDCVPDLSVRLLSSEVRVRNDGSSLIINRVLFSLTLLCFPPISEDNQKIKQLLDQGNIVMKEAKDGLVTQGPDAEELMDLIRRSENMPAIWEGKQSIEPIHTNNECFVIIHLDENGLIDSFDIFDKMDAPEKFYLPLQRCLKV